VPICIGESRLTLGLVAFLYALDYRSISVPVPLLGEVTIPSLRGAPARLNPLR
jgi:hypothetical protein